MKRYIVTIFIMIALFGCKDTIEMQAMKEKLLLANKKYFNSERAAKILYEESSRYFKYGTFLYSRPNSRILRFTLTGNEPPYRMKIVKTKKPSYSKKNNEDVFYFQVYIRNNTIDAMCNSNGELVQFYHGNKKSNFKITDTGLDVDATKSYYTSCSFYKHKGSRYCIVREFNEDNMENNFKEDPYSLAKKVFKNYAKYYNRKEIIYDKHSKMIKKIDYKDKKIKYYFYRGTKRYMVVCDYILKSCKIKHNCAYRNSHGKNCSLLPEG